MLASIVIFALLLPVALWLCSCQSATGFEPLIICRCFFSVSFSFSCSLFSPHSLLCLRDWFLFSCFSIGPHRSVRVYSYSAVFSLSKAPKSSVHWQLLKHTVVVIFTSFFDRADVSGMFVCVFFFRMYWKLWETVAAEVANAPGYIIIMGICCYQTMKNGWSRREMFLGFFFSLAGTIVARLRQVKS